MPRRLESNARVEGSEADGPLPGHVCGHPLRMSLLISPVDTLMSGRQALTGRPATRTIRDHPRVASHALRRPRDLHPRPGDL